MPLRIIDLGFTLYDAAYRAQLDHLEEVLASRAAGEPEIGRILLVEHPPVITITRRPGVAAHLLATPAMLRAAGVAVAETDRGGDITYHGPGQLIAYPILDLDRLNLGLHEYMRLLESAVIDVCASYGLPARRDPGATGVWIDPPAHANGHAGSGGVQPAAAKICAMGVRIRRWITLHGLALNVTTNLDHFGLIVPCGLAGRPVTSLDRELTARGRACPPMPEVKRDLASELSAHIDRAAARADTARTVAVREQLNPSA